MKKKQQCTLQKYVLQEPNNAKFCFKLALTDWLAITCNLFIFNSLTNMLDVLLTSMQGISTIRFILFLAYGKPLENKWYVASSDSVGPISF